MARYSLHTPEQVSVALAGRVRELRLVRGWRQVTLAERSGVSQLGQLKLQLHEHTGGRSG